MPSETDDLNLDDLPGDGDRQPAGEKATITVGPDGGDLATGTLEAELKTAGDWDHIFAEFGLDPAVFQIVDDTVRMSKWQQSRRLASGHRDMVWLYSYRARFRRRPPELPSTDVDELRAYIRSWKPSSTKRKPGGRGQPCTFVVCWADWQIGKSAGGGVRGTVERIERSFQLATERLLELRKAGRNVEKVAILNMGDPIEGCYGQYESQLFTVELTMREQYNLVLDLWIKGCEMLRPDLFASVLCNHGETSRAGTGGRQRTSDSDNAGGYLADTLRRVFERTRHGPTEWSIPHDEMYTVVHLSGLPVGLHHGHKAPRNLTAKAELDWLRGQSLRLLRQQQVEPRLWVLAHRHHVSVTDLGPFWRIQCPSEDGGSKWFEDVSGQWASPGTLTFLAGEHDVRGFSDLAVLGGRP